MSKRRIYLDNAAGTKVASEVIEVMLPFFGETFGNASSLHQFGKEAKTALEKARKTIAQQLNAEPHECIFTSSGSESNNLAITGIALANKDKGDHIITTTIEHPSVLDTCKVLEQQGFKVTYLPVDKYGLISLEELEKTITSSTILVSIIHANNEVGAIQNIQQIGECCKRKEVYFHTDAVQSFTKVPIDVNKDHLDLISVSAHKLHGPKGVGGLYVRKGLFKGSSSKHHNLYK